MTLHPVNHFGHQCISTLVWHFLRVDHLWFEIGGHEHLCVKICKHYVYEFRLCSSYTDGTAEW